MVELDEPDLRPRLLERPGLRQRIELHFAGTTSTVSSTRRIEAEHTLFSERWQFRVRAARRSVTNVRNFHECAAGMNLAIERGRV